MVPATQDALNEPEISEAPSDSTGPGVPKPSGKVRWIVCGLLFFAVVLSYIDRLVIAVLKPELATQYDWSETGYADLTFYFSLAYGLSYVLAGRVMDRVGARVGYALAVTIWTIGHVLHIAFTSTAGMIWARIPLAIGEAATFPAALAATNEWFPRRERALAIGIFNAGSNVGAIVTPLLVPLIAAAFGWRWAFIASGALTVIWVIAWLAFYRSPDRHPRVSREELEYIRSEPQPHAEPASFRALLKLRQTWAYMAGRFLIDPVWWVFLFWLPDFFNKQFGLTMLEFGPPLVAIYLMADGGSILGGLISSKLLGRGRSVNGSRKIAYLCMALCTLPIAFAAYASSIWVAIALIGLACAGHQGFSANLFALPGDLFPRRMAGSVIGLGGLAGAVGSMLLAKYAGLILELVGSYEPIFLVAACAYLIALAVIHLILPRYSALTPEQIENIQ
ncbi:MFS transporter [Stakelama saccharophila]|uniref:MFS transporter n=1 Tax=Stakelama saccharophila TaxID=3075605 RepID=A0ABZ0B4S2_9SPHN|nr:MFS transporter [Stakelama sp. W311]WNO52386.1 MFS transporter [Stakelama sp. W311]